jgi:hypothetical protein
MGKEVNEYKRKGRLISDLEFLSVVRIVLIEPPEVSLT